MKPFSKLLFGIILFSITLKLSAPDRHELIIFQYPAVTLQDLVIDAMGMVESNNDDFAVNEREGAFGRYQIRSIKLKWYAQRTGKNYTLCQCFDKEISLSILKYHLSQYDDLDKSIKAWNGRGPKAERYLKRVKERL